jgi:trigger factor
VRTHINGWFWSAAAEHRIRPVAEPNVEWETLPAQGKTFTFTATVDVMPKPVIADWKELEVGAPEPEVPGEAIDAELEVLRSSVAELTPVEDRPVVLGDTVVVDIHGDEETGDYVLEVGAGRLRPELEHALIGAQAGETKVVELELDGKTSIVQLALKEIQEKVLPPADDDFAQAATEFDTIDELRADIEERLTAQLDDELEVRFREDAIDALANASTLERIEILVESGARTLASSMVQSLEQRGVSFDAYIAATGQSPEDIQERLRSEADRSVRRELVLEAVADQLDITIDDDEIEELIRNEAEEVGDDADGAINMIRERGGFPKIREDIRYRKALDAIVGDVKRIPVELAAAREKLWTPEKEKGGSAVKLWTPGSEENP